MLSPIQKIDLTLDVTELRKFLDKSTYWNQHKVRTIVGSPHEHVSDIWARYGDINNPTVRANDMAFQCNWYYSDLTLVLRPFIDKVMETVNGKQLGGVLITKIPAGKNIKAHTDSGWHAGYYSKYIVCVAANMEQRFWYPEYIEIPGDQSELHTKTGECFWFRNDKLHAVDNPSNEDRISLICCIRTQRGPLEP